MPVPTTVQVWSKYGDVLQSFTTNGWNGSNNTLKEQKTIKLSRVKAEQGFSAADYFSLVFENITNRSDVNMEDLTGTELEAAETELFRRSIAESIRATMWIGDTDSDDEYNTFDGFLKVIFDYIDNDAFVSTTFQKADLADSALAIECFENCWLKGDQKLRDLKGDGELTYYVTSDIYHLYELYLDKMGVSNAYVDLINGRKTLSYHGIPVIDLQISSYVKNYSDYPENFCLLTDRRNLVMAVNTADFPGSEVRMWYNPDEMENRQRAVFMAGCEVVDHSITSFSYQAD